MVAVECLKSMMDTEDDLDPLAIIKCSECETGILEVVDPAEYFQK